MTGYTSKLCEEGQTFEEFTLQCARAFGVLSSLRDESLDSKIPDQLKPDTHYQDALADAIDEHNKLSTMTSDQSEKYGASLIKKHLTYLEQARNKTKLIRERILSMIEKVNSWVPPTDKHIDLKNFMLEQLQRTLEVDGDVSYYDTEIAANSVASAKEIYQEFLEAAASVVEFYNKKLIEEQKRTAKTNEWLTALRTSLRA
jgi:hypothetical protein